MNRLALRTISSTIKRQYDTKILNEQIFASMVKKTPSQAKIYRRTGTDTVFKLMEGNRSNIPVNGN